MVRNTAAARLIGSYNQLYEDAGESNEIIRLIRHACMRAKIEDATVPPSPGVRWNVVLRSWSTKISEDFERNNPQRPNMEAPVATILHSLGDQFSGFDRRIAMLEATVREQTKTNAASVLESDHNGMMTQQIKTLKAQLSEKTAESKQHRERYKQLLAMHHSQLQSPIASPERLSLPPPCTTDALPGSLARKFNDVSSLSSASKASSSTVRAPESVVLDSLGLAKTVTSGTEVAGELFRLWKAKKFFVGGTTKRILFDAALKDFVGVKPGFSEKKRYKDGMMCVAMAITPKQWKALQTPDVNGTGPRTEVFDIQKCTLLKVLELEIQWGVKGVKTKNKKDKSKPGLNSIGMRFCAIKKKMKAMKKSDTEVTNIIDRLIGQTGSECQSTLAGFLVAK